MAKNTEVLEIAKKLRRNLTKAENILWQELRNNKLGAKFRRQMPFVFGDYHYVVDFYCARKKLIIEIDGSIHNDLEIQKYDVVRENLLKASGYIVIRFKNEDVFCSLDNVLDKIREHLR